ncbi:hypothetical protein B0H10DRAFT_1951011 [Mycena sp. CBHHK59/15]|nr:hypothetical protein B0H10DRAFT_1951011 [Mycena sp. CBHHK59/15]
MVETKPAPQRARWAQLACALWASWEQMQVDARPALCGQLRTSAGTQLACSLQGGVQPDGRGGFPVGVFPRQYVCPRMLSPRCISGGRSRVGHPASMRTGGGLEPPECESAGWEGTVLDLEGAEDAVGKGSEWGVGHGSGGCRATPSERLPRQMRGHGPFYRVVVGHQQQVKQGEAGGQHRRTWAGSSLKTAQHLPAPHLRYCCQRLVLRNMASSEHLCAPSAQLWVCHQLAPMGLAWHQIMSREPYELDSPSAARVRITKDEGKAACRQEAGVMTSPTMPSASTSDDLFTSKTDGRPSVYRASTICLSSTAMPLLFIPDDVAVLLLTTLDSAAASQLPMSFGQLRTQPSSAMQGPQQAISQQQTPATCFPESTTPLPLPPERVPGPSISRRMNTYIFQTTMVLSPAILFPAPFTMVLMIADRTS